MDVLSGGEKQRMAVRGTGRREGGNYKGARVARGSFMGLPICILEMDVPS